MLSRFWNFVLITAILAFVPRAFSQRPSAQTREAVPAVGSKPAPRSPDGKPDLSGMWKLQRGTEANWFSYVRAGNLEIRGRQTGATVAEELMKPEAKEKYASQLRSGKTQGIDRDILDPTIRGCAPLGLTRMLQQDHPFEIISLPSRFFFHFEWDHWPRDVWMDGRELGKDMPPTWIGYSTGKWEGDTLVVTTVGFNDLTWLDNLGHPHTEALRITERYARLSYDTLQVQVTFEDTEIYTKPLVGNTLTYRLVTDGAIEESLACDNRIPLILKTDVCEVSGAWEFEAYCERRKAGLPTNTPAESNAPDGVY
jgi:hypothetical protein